MLTIKYLKENYTEAIERLMIRNVNYTSQIDQAIEIDTTRINIQIELDEILSSTKKYASEIGLLLKVGKLEEAETVKKETAVLKERSKELNEKLKETQELLVQKLSGIPNVPNLIVPKGKSDTDNLEIRSGGDMPKLHEKAAPHWDLTTKYNIIDFELGNKITGAGFPVYIGKGAMLQRALINFFLQQANLAGYTEIMPPLLVNKDSGFGTGQLPDKEGQMYHATVDDFYLIPTAEVPLTNIYRDVILSEEDFPIKITGYTPCFRREAGSYGKDVRGLNRLHQFDKVEIVRIDKPENSYKILDEMVEYVESLIKKLGLPYRIVRLCGGDLGFTSALTYDFEVYSAAQQKWLEVSSVSNFESFQANRLKLRYKTKTDKQTILAHTLNGSALALPRILAAILENNQTENGINIPEVLIPFTGFETIN